MSKLVIISIIFSAFFLIPDNAIAQNSDVAIRAFPRGPVVRDPIIRDPEIRGPVIRDPVIRNPEILNPEIRGPIVR